MTKFYAALAFLLVANIQLGAQRISLLNPSFEDAPRRNSVPRGWFNCGAPNESPPDVLPDGIFQVSTKPYAGNTYLGMVTRDNNTWEAVGAELTASLDNEICYSFSIALCASDSYESVSRVTNLEANFIAPTVLRIWGSDDSCSRSELLAQSPPINHSEWQLYTFILKPTKDHYNHIVLEAFYPDNVSRFTNGNLILDAASAFIVLPDCEMNELGLSPTPSAVEESPNATSEVVQITEASNRKKSQRRRPSDSDSDEVITLELPGADYFSNEDNLRSFASHTLTDLSFTPDQELLILQFRLAEEYDARNGHPAWYALQHALQFYPEQAWELVVYADDPMNSDLRVLELGRQLSAAKIRLSVVPYNSEIHDGVEWFCMSVANGLYLLKRE
jgi:hypothetical protein